MVVIVMRMEKLSIMWWIGCSSGDLFIFFPVKIRVKCFFSVRGGKFMMRLYNGVTTSAHTRYLANVIKEYGEDGCDNNTDWRICCSVLPNVPEILKGLAVLVRFIVM
nr:unnamed protein product [Brassica rapa]